MKIEFYDPADELAVGTVEMSVVPRIGENVSIRSHEGSLKYEVTGVLYTLDNEASPTRASYGPVRPRTREGHPVASKPQGKAEDLPAAFR